MDLRKSYRKIRAKKKALLPNNNHRMRLYYAEHYEDEVIDEDLVLYETRDGKSIVDSPLAIFAYLINNDKFNHLKHVWVINKNSEGIEKTFPEAIRKRVKFVYRDTIEYVDVMLKAKYLISDSTFESFFVKRPGQVYINTWHGTPLKYMGFDIPGTVAHSKNVLRNFLMTDYILSPNAHTSKIFIDSYKLKGLYKGEILEGGYPRIDFTLAEDFSGIQYKLKTFGVIFDPNKKTILYCPTWKGKNVNKANDDVEQIVKESLILKERFGREYNVFVKVHPFIFSKIKKDERVNGFLISDLIDANQLLALVDILITDYSSIFFDFLVTKKPIIFYAWDKDLYSFERGMYLEDSDLPGPTAENIYELCDLIENVKDISRSYKGRYDELAKQMVVHDDGKVTGRYVNYIFDGTRTDKIKIYNVESSKKKLLIYPGGMKSNGITTSFLNLTNNIDYSKYDVTIITNPPKSNEINNNLKAMNSNVRPMFRFGIDILTKKEKKLNKQFAERGVDIDKRNLYPDIGYKRETSRLLANMEFDVAIDFSGYSYFWGRHILGAKAKKYIAFMHNDLMADSQREVNGKMPMYRDLNGIFSIYYKFDKLLSVSPMTRDVNLSKLKNYVNEAQMSYVYNTINIEKILENHVAKKEINPVKVFKRRMKFKKDGTIPYYTDIQDVYRGKEKSKLITKDLKVVQYARLEYENNYYAKISVEDIYLGWIDEAELIKQPLEIKRIQKRHGFATVSRNLNYPIWKKIDVEDREDWLLAYARNFKGRYLEIEKIAYTNIGRYFFVRYCGKDLGWLSPKPLVRTHWLKKLSPLNFYFKTRMMKMEKENHLIFTNKVTKTQAYAKLIPNNNIEIFSQPKGVPNARLVPFSNKYYDQAFKVEEECLIGDVSYSKLSFDDHVSLGYVNSKYISNISEREYISTQESQQNENAVDNLIPKVDLDLQGIPPLDKSYFNVVNMGRLSPEKNQMNLIYGFSKFREKYPKSRLFILGKGPLSKDLIQAIHETEQEGYIFLLGHINLPFNFMKETDLFALPSLYEGQPMVLLEAMTLGMKILASNIPANINVVGKDETYGLLTEGTDKEAICKGLERMYTYTNDFKTFNPYEYNKKAIQSFYNEINS
ncbi:CDP-glycerol glycerophosphotransferase family protein [Pediococcus acidilactici]|uniref:CDP-glycerol glycerophosphotransferase family protein n=1 Tax=Pediococcus acidilactici TaxID=1254 RepID=UPI001F2B365B|nr:CDP-glycerol glycerophosphotransferase family protein [Pediococcus acidilactici]MCF4060748.1 CDP-glycerol glycerophosphotransferase family protein [Pediococcus acidilactici]